MEHETASVRSHDAAVKVSAEEGEVSACHLFPTIPFRFQRRIFDLEPTTGTDIDPAAGLAPPPPVQYVSVCYR